MKEEIKAPKIELSDEERVKLPDGEFKTLVIRMLTEMVEYSHKIEEKVKAMQSEIKIIQGTKREGKETRIQINALEQKEEIIILPSEQNKETRIQKKNEERLRNLQDNFKHSNI